MNINLYKIFLLIFCLCFWISCDDPEDSSDNSIDDPNQDENTLDEDSVGSYQANLEDMLFYNFESGSPIDYAYDFIQLME